MFIYEGVVVHVGTTERLTCDVSIKARLSPRENDRICAAPILVGVRVLVDPVPKGHIRQGEIITLSDVA